MLPNKLLLRVARRASWVLHAVWAHFCLLSCSIFNSARTRLRRHLSESRTPRFSRYVGALTPPI
jgi:hypothetical protein